MNNAHNIDQIPYHFIDLLPQDYHGKNQGIIEGNIWQDQIDVAQTSTQEYLG